MNQKYTAEQYRDFITQILESIEDVHFLRAIYSIVARKAWAKDA